MEVYCHLHTMLLAKASQQYSLVHAMPSLLVFWILHMREWSVPLETPGKHHDSKTFCLQAIQLSETLQAGTQEVQEPLVQRQGMPTRRKVAVFSWTLAARDRQYRVSANHVIIINESRQWECHVAGPFSKESPGMCPMEGLTGLTWGKGRPQKSGCRHRVILQIVFFRSDIFSSTIQESHDHVSCCVIHCKGSLSTRARHND